MTCALRRSAERAHVGSARSPAYQPPAAFLKNPQPTSRSSRQFRASPFPDEAVSSSPERSRGAHQSRPERRHNRLQIGTTRLRKRRGRDSNPRRRKTPRNGFRVRRGAESPVATGPFEVLADNGVGNGVASRATPPARQRAALRRGRETSTRGRSPNRRRRCPSRHRLARRLCDPRPPCPSAAQFIAGCAGVRPWRRITSANAPKSGGPPAEAARTSASSWK